MRQSSAVPSTRRRILGALSSGWVRFAAAVAVAASLLIVVRASDDGATTAQTVLAILVLAVAILGVAGVLVTLAGFDGDAPEIAGRLVADDEIQRRLLTRWLERARWYRFVGGLCGCVIWAIGFQTNADLLVCGALGICLGAILAEVHHLRRARAPRVARLEVRSLDDYLSVPDRRAMQAVAVAAGVVAIAGLVLGASNAVLAWSGAAVVVLAVVHLAQRRVVSRGRPALPESLRAADDLARRLAVGRGLARPATYASLAMVARALFELEPEFGVAPLLGVVAWLVAAGMWWRNRRLGLDHLVHMSSTSSPDPVPA